MMGSYPNGYGFAVGSARRDSLYYGFEAFVHISIASSYYSPLFIIYYCRL